MEEFGLALAVVTETWLYDCEVLRTFDTDMLHGRALSFIHRCRKKLKRSNPGGGVSLAFRKSLINLKESPIKRKTYEIVAAQGKIPNITTPL